MAKSTSLQVFTTDTNGNNKTQNIPYANPDATDSQLLQFAQSCNALTTNTFIDATRIDKISLSESTQD